MSAALNQQIISDRAASYCEDKGYRAGPTRKVAYQAFVAGAQEPAATLLGALQTIVAALREARDTGTSSVSRCDLIATANAAIDVYGIGRRA